MTKSEAATEMFWLAFTNLPKKDKQTILRRMIKDTNLRRDLMDLAVIEERRDEPGIPLREYMKKRSATLGKNY